MSSVRRTISRSIKRKLKKPRKTPKFVAVARSTPPVSSLNLGNQTKDEKQKKPTAARRFKSMIENIVKKVKSWVA